MARSRHPQLVAWELQRLEAELLPFLARSRWYGISTVEYLRLAPALRIANRLVLSERAMMFWHAFLFGRRDSKHATDGVDYQSFHRIYTKTLPAEEQQKVRVILDDLADALFFEMAENMRWTICGACQEQKDKYPADGSAKPRDGVRSVISFNKFRFEDLIDQYKHEVDPKSYERTCLQFGLTLLHEFAHAIGMAFRGSLPEEFFEDYTFTEMGHAVETFVVGGAISCKWDEAKNQEVMMLVRLPYPELVETYRSGHGYRLSDETIPARQIKHFTEHDTERLMGEWYGMSPPVPVSSWRLVDEAWNIIPPVKKQHHRTRKTLPRPRKATKTNASQPLESRNVQQVDEQDCRKQARNTTASTTGEEAE